MAKGRGIAKKRASARAASPRGAASAKLARYPVPREAGGILCRKLVAGFSQDPSVQLPISSHILIAASAGLDSTALAHCLAKYGRRVGGREQLTLLHINHGWRGRESDGDQAFVQKLARKLGLPLIVENLKGRPIPKGQSWEDFARRERARIYAEHAERLDALVFTAHHADDLAETLLWRLFTGTAQTHGGGISFRNGREIRPLLGVRKELLKRYLKEERQTWREDRTNHEGRFLRARMRQSLMPIIEKLFPRAVEHLIEAGLEAQRELRDGYPHDTEELLQAPRWLFGASGLRARRAHWDLLKSKLTSDPAWVGEIHLPGGWRLVRERHDLKAGQEKWILEKHLATN